MTPNPHKLQAGPELGAVTGSAFREGAVLKIVRLSETIPLHAQGKGRPRVGDIVRVGNGVSAVNVQPYLSEPWYWCLGRNETGEYGAKFTHSDLMPNTD